MKPHRRSSFVGSSASSESEMTVPTPAHDDDSASTVSLGPAPMSRRRLLIGGALGLAGAAYAGSSVARAQIESLDKIDGAGSGLEQASRITTTTTTTVPAGDEADGVGDDGTGTDGLGGGDDGTDGLGTGDGDGAGTDGDGDGAGVDGDGIDGGADGDVDRDSDGLVDGDVVTEFEVEEGEILFPIVVGEGDSVYVSDNFGACRSGCSRSHEGTDMMADRHLPIRATANGVLTKRYEDSGKTYGAGHGWTLVDEENDVTWKFFHMDHHATGLEVGDTVEIGQIIGAVGNTGTSGANSDSNYHLHFEYRPGNTAANSYSKLQRDPNVSFG